MANISTPTLKRIEAAVGPAPGYANNLAAIRTALEAAGVIFVDENGEGPGVRLKKVRQDNAATTIPLEDLNAENDE